MKLVGLRTVLVIPPIRGADYNFFTSENFETLYPVMEAFSLVTYDFSNPQRPGANAPLMWARQCVENICPNTIKDFATKRRKILIGMNMYGYDYTLAGGDSGPITANTYFKLLEKAEGRMIHDEHDEENFIEIKWVFFLHPIFLFQFSTSFFSTKFHNYRSFHELQETKPSYCLLPHAVLDLQAH